MVLFGELVARALFAHAPDACNLFVMGSKFRKRASVNHDLQGYPLMRKSALQ